MKRNTSTSKGLRLLAPPISATRNFPVPQTGTAHLPELLPKAKYIKAKTSKDVPYLPIEIFRREDLLTRLGVYGTTRKFRSSGTTSDHRSHSWFSEQGLSLYQERSVSHFLDILKILFKENSNNCRGISLVPDASTWPDSSLAQMVGWIAEKTPVTYADSDNLKAIIQAGDCEKPFWIFGTAFHFVNLFDQGVRIAVPPTTIIFETGGTKGQSRSVERQELFEIIAKIFSLPLNQIVSEYGMSELACQAYDAFSRNKVASPDQRWFRFHESVELAVMPEPGVLKSEGEGLLVINDPHRVDFPWPIRTEDRADLKKDGSFRLLGRALKAPLKGCSTTFEHLLKTPIQKKEASEGQSFSLPKISIDTASHGWVSFHTRKNAFLKFPNHMDRHLLHQALVDEFGNSHIADWALSDIFIRFPDETELDGLYQNFQLGLTDNGSQMEGAASDDRWLLILPENHSIVGFYPMLLAYLFGIKITLRIPKRFQHSNSALQTFLTECQKHLPGFDILSLPHSFRLQEHRNHPYDYSFSPTSKILCYGSDKTVTQLENAFPGRTQAFGESWSMSLIHGNELIGDQYPTDAILKDFFSLNQLGCKSSRLLLIFCDNPYVNVPYEKIIESLITWICNKDLGTVISGDQKLRESLELESVKYRLEGFKTYWNQILIPYGKEILVPSTEQFSKTFNLSLISASSPGIIPILTLKPDHALDPKSKQIFYNNIAHQILLQPHLNQLNMSFRAKNSLEKLLNKKCENLNICELGQGNQEFWDGYHQGKQLFLDLTFSGKGGSDN